MKKSPLSLAIAAVCCTTHHMQSYEFKLPASKEPGTKELETIVEYCKKNSLFNKNDDEICEKLALQQQKTPTYTCKCIENQPSVVKAQTTTFTLTPLLPGDEKSRVLENWNELRKHINAKGRKSFTSFGINLFSLVTGMVAHDLAPAGGKRFFLHAILYSMISLPATLSFGFIHNYWYGIDEIRKTIDNAMTFLK